MSTDQEAMPLTGTLDPDAIRVGKRGRKDLGDIESLAYSIEQVGQKDPVILTTDRSLISGFRRIEACRLLGLSVNVVYTNDFIVAKNWKDHEQSICQEPMKPSEVVALSRVFEALYDSGPTPKGTKRELLGEAVGWGGTRLLQGRRVVEAAENGEPDAAAALDFMDKVGKINGAFRRVEHIDPTPRKPFKADSPRNINVAEKNKGRLWAIINGLEGTELGLRDFDVNKALATADADEEKQMTRSLAQSIRALRRLRREIQSTEGAE
jgi:hypothetical protein